MKDERKWADLTLKDKLAFVTCIAAFVLGWGMTIAGFVADPLGEVHDSVLWILGQSLIYTASVIGLSMVVTDNFRKIRHELGLKNNKEDDDGED